MGTQIKDGKYSSLDIVGNSSVIRHKLTAGEIVTPKARIDELTYVTLIPTILKSYYYRGFPIATTFSIADSVSTRMQVDTQVNPDFGTDGQFITVNAVEDTFECITAGLFDIRACIRYDANATGVRHIMLVHTDSKDAKIEQAKSSANALIGAGINTGLSTSAMWNLAVGDRVTVMCWQNSTAPLDLVNSATYTENFLQITRVV